MNTIENGTDFQTPEQITAAYFESIKDNHAALRQFFTAMPKGGDIHNHLTGAAYAETYFELAADKGMYVDLATGKLYKEAPADIETIQLSKDMDDLHNKRMTLIDKWSIRNFEPYKYPLGPDEYFFGTFGLLSALTSLSDYDDDDSLENLAYLMYDLKARAVNENVQYLEVIGIAPNIPEYCFLSKNDYEKYDKKLKDIVKSGDYIGVHPLLTEILSLLMNSKDAQNASNKYLDAIYKLEDKSEKISKKRHIDTSNVVCRYQGYTVRGLEPLMVFAQLYVVNRACSNDKGKLLTGCNIVAAEDGEKSMLYYELHMNMFVSMSIFHTKTSLHAGELTLGLVRPEYMKDHVQYAVAIGSDRIGHGVDIPFEKDSKSTMKLMKKERKPIPIEINLTSNEFILGVKGSEHPITLYHEFGIPVIISTDDPGILRTSLTEQYALAALRYGFSYKEIKEFVYNSIKYSFLTDEEKTTQTNKLQDLFSEFELIFTQKLSCQ